MNAVADQLANLLPHWAYGFLLVLARVGTAIVVLPGLAEQEIPVQARAGFAVALTVLILPGIEPALPAPAPDGALPISILLAEMGTGLWFGLLVRVIMQSLPIAFQYIATLIGLASVLQPDAAFGPQTTALARLATVLVPAIILMSDLHRLPLYALMHLYDAIPIGTVLPMGDGAETAVGTVSLVLSLALRLASPFVVAGVLGQLTLGLVARLAPRIQVYALALPGQILGGLLLLLALFGSLLSAWQDAVGDCLRALARFG